MILKLRETWISVQKAETMLFRAAALPKISQYRKLLEDFGLENGLLGLLIRMINGFNPDNLTPQDYLIRYPYSSVEAIKAGMEQLVESGHILVNKTVNYAATEHAKQGVSNWQQGVAELMQSVDLGDIPSTYVQRLLEYDLKILNAFKATSRPHGNPILGHRLHGLHPPYDPPMLWHHWMHVWTMIAAREDEEDYVRKLHGLDPLVWFVRRQVWFIDRRPWLSRVRTFDDLVRRATGYAPITCAESACQNAIDDLKTRNWLVDVDGNFHLTELGMKTCDRDEKEVDEHFLSSWPLLSDLEIEELNQITNRMNERFVFIVEQIREA